jgi:hypothetical protein
MCGSGVINNAEHPAGALPFVGLLHHQAVAHVMLVDVADVGHRLAPDLASRDDFDVPEPFVRVESQRCGPSSQLRNPRRTGVVRRHGEQPPVDRIEPLVVGPIEAYAVPTHTRAVSRNERLSTPSQTRHRTTLTNGPGQWERGRSRPRFAVIHEAPGSEHRADAKGVADERPLLDLG